MAKLYSTNSEIQEELKAKFPNVAYTVCAAFGVSQVFYADDSYNNKVAESRYSKVENIGSFLGVFLTLKRFDK